MQHEKIIPHRRVRPVHLSDTGVVLQNGRVHEACGTATDVFAAVVAARLGGPLIWIGRVNGVGSLAPTALQTFFDPANLITVGCQTRKETLWAGEQSLRCGGTGGVAMGVIMEMGLGPDLTESRRLQLAAEAGGALGVVLIGKAAQSSAAQTRWQCDALPYDESWRWRLQKNKAGSVGVWDAQWRVGPGGGDINGTSGDVHMVAASAA